MGGDDENLRRRINTLLPKVLSSDSEYEKNEEIAIKTIFSKYGAGNDSRPKQEDPYKSTKFRIEMKTTPGASGRQSANP